MDFFGDILEPYTNEIAKIAGTVTCLQFLSGVFLLNDIRKIGSSDAYPPEPFLGGIVLTLLSLKLGALMNDAAMINVNVIGFGVNLLFMIVFYLYSSNEFKTKIWKKIGIASLFTLVCLAYAIFEDPLKIEFRFGLLITGILVMLVGMPLLNLGEIVRKQSTEGLPFPIILSGTIVATSWFLYGISIRNAVVIYQNLFLLSLSVIQLSLFAIYPSKPLTSKSSKLNSPSTMSYKRSRTSPSEASLYKKTE